MHNGYVSVAVQWGAHSMAEQLKRRGCSEGEEGAVLARMASAYVVRYVAAATLQRYN